MTNILASTGFEFFRMLWQIINLLILLSILGMVVLFPRWVIKKINSIEKSLDEINKKLDRKE